MSDPLDIYLPDPAATAPPGVEPYIPRPPNAFMIYRMHKNSEMKLNNEQSRTQSQISKDIGARWGAEPAEVQLAYKKLAQAVKDRHKARFPHYKFQPGKNGKKKSKPTAHLTEKSEETQTQMPSPQSTATGTPSSFSSRSSASPLPIRASPGLSTPSPLPSAIPGASHAWQGMLSVIPDGMTMKQYRDLKNMQYGHLMRQLCCQTQQLHDEIMWAGDAYGPEGRRQATLAYEQALQEQNRWSAMGPPFPTHVRPAEESKPSQWNAEHAPLNAGFVDFAAAQAGSARVPPQDAADAGYSCPYTNQRYDPITVNDLFPFGEHPIPSPSADAHRAAVPEAPPTYFPPNGVNVPSSRAQVELMFSLAESHQWTGGLPNLYGVASRANVHSENPLESLPAEIIWPKELSPHAQASLNTPDA